VSAGPDDRLTERFAFPEDRYYFAFTRGPVRFVCLDSGEDKPDDHPAYSGLAAFRSYREQQTPWLRTEAASPAFRAARFRVVLIHIPPPADAWIREHWHPILASAGVDVIYSGHTHRWICAAPAAGQPYTQIVGGGYEPGHGTVGRLTADAETLQVTLYDEQGRVLADRRIGAAGPP
jgi:hypothetical protein